MAPRYRSLENMLWAYFAEHLLDDYRPDAINMTLPDGRSLRVI